MAGVTRETTPVNRPLVPLVHCIGLDSKPASLKVYIFISPEHLQPSNIAVSLGDLVYT